MYKIKEFAVVHKGIIREKNEDNVFLNEFYLPEKNEGLKNYSNEKSINSPLFYASFDGIGGLEKGNEASYLCSKYLLQGIRNKINNKDLLKYINQKLLLNNEKENIECGSTANLVCINNKNIDTYQVGDSSIFVLQDESSKLCYNDVKLIDNYIGSNKLEVKHNKFELKDNTKILICSDGLTKFVNDNEIEYILDSSDDVEYITNKLLNMALSNGGNDNVTIITLLIKKQSNEALYLLLLSISIIIFLFLLTLI